VNGKDCIDDIRCKLFSEGAVQFRGKRRPSNREQQFTVNVALNLKLVEELYNEHFSLLSDEFKVFLFNTDLQSFILGNLVTIRDNSGMQPLRDIPISLLQELSDHQDDGRRSVTGNIVLCCGGAGNHNLVRVSKKRYPSSNRG
jgi:hypothetical protein